jgi:protein-S-isoprenylcysteine O-methyltransferase Ste14
LKHLGAFAIFLIVPGSIFVYIPFLVGIFGPQVSQFWPAERELGILAGLIGISLATWSVVELAQHGGGTPAPNQPPSLLVNNELNRHSLNPMYLAANMIVPGWYFWFQIWFLSLYFLGVCRFFYLLITRFEELALRHKFGQTYVDYCTSVPRWL